MGGVVALALFALDRSGTADSSAEADGATDRVSRSTAIDAAGGTTAGTSRLAKDTAAQRVFSPTQLMIAPESPELLAEIAASIGAEVSREVGRSGYGAVALVDGEVSPDLIARLRAKPLVAGIAPQGLMMGAGGPPPEPGLRRYQWHRKGARMRRLEEGDVARDYSEWVVAVLDTGVAYEDYSDDQHDYAAAGTLVGNPVVAPMDFVNGDAHANDDHQHGTHIASIIASKDDGAIEGQIEGIAAGVGIMPVKVLDENNAGTEIDLVEAIYHAIDNGADVINMSLSFQQGYIPSVALNEALEAAARADILLVAAAGNDSAGALTWPAASPLVIGVGSVTTENDKQELRKADYSNLSSSVDILAPGGSVADDMDEDGLSDGILAQSIALNEPGEVGYWYYAGTSQAAAMVSGALVQLLDAGATPLVARNALLLAAEDDVGAKWEGNTGAGTLNIEGALEFIEDEEEAIYESGRYHTALLPALYSKNEGEVIPVASVSVVDDDGVPVEGMTAWVSFTGDVNAIESCETDELGWCYVKVDGIATIDEDTGAELPLAIATELSTLVSGNDVAHHPTPVMFAHDGLELMLAGLDTQPALQGAALTIEWTDTTTDPILERLAGSYTVMNSGSGLATSPVGLVFNRAAIQAYASATSYEVDLDGTGLATSPVGFVTINRLIFDGSGLATSPVGLFGLRLASFDGSGLATSPVGLSAWHLFRSIGDMDGTDGTGLATSPVGFNWGGLPIMVDLDGTGLATSPVGLTPFTGTRLGALMQSGGHVTGTGHPVAAALRASGVMDVAPEQLVPFPEGEGNFEADAQAMLDALVEYD